MKKQLWIVSVVLTGSFLLAQGLLAQTSRSVPRIPRLPLAPSPPTKG